MIKSSFTLNETREVIMYKSTFIRCLIWNATLIVLLSLQTGYCQADIGGGDVSDAWTTKAPMPTSRMALSSSVVDGIIYAIGGTRHFHQPAYAIVEAYDPETDAWTTKAPMPTLRAGLSTCVVDGIIYAIGGGSDVESPGLSTVEAYDPATNTWTPKRDMPTPRGYPSTSVVDGIIYAIGGGSDTESPLSTVEAYDPATDTWTTKGDMPGPMAALSTCVVDGIIYAIGGFANAAMTGLSTVRAYDPKTDTWTEKDDMSTPRAALSTCVIDGIIYAIGGRIYPYGGSSSVEAYDPVTNTWMTKSDMPTARCWLSSSMKDGKIYTIGGLHDGGPVATVEEYDPSADLTSVEDVSEANAVPSGFALSQNYPNPFNPSTTIRFDLPKSSFVTLRVYDLLGKEITTLVNEKKSSGEYTIDWNGKDLPSGLYIYQLKAGDFTETRKLVLQK
jgi:N-acetylneuraminic acid mutarotase